MAISQFINFEVWPTTGSDSNGGGFKVGASGTDYSKQTTPQYALTGIASVGSGNVVLSATAAADMVGNTAQVVSGTNFTTGFYEITSVSIGVSITFSTNVAGGSICTGVGASGVINIGGALTTVTQGIIAANPGNIIWVKTTGTYTVTASLTLSTDNSIGTVNSASPVTIIGYTTTHLDNGRFTWTTATNSINLIVGNSNANGWIFANINFTTTASTKLSVLFAGVSTQLYLFSFLNCVIDGFTVGLNAGYQGGVTFNTQYLYLSSVEIKNCSSHGMSCSGARLFGCYIHDNGGDGVRWDEVGSGSNSTIGVTIIDTVIDNNTNNGINFTSAPNPTSNNYTFLELYNSAVTRNGNGIRLDTDTSSAGNAISIMVRNTIIYNNTGSGFRFGKTPTGILEFSNNGWGANGSGNATYFNGVTPLVNIVGPGDVTLTTSPFTSIGSDFTLNSTSGGGADLKNVGYRSTVIPGA